MNEPCGLQCARLEFADTLRPRPAVALSHSALAQVRFPTWNCYFRTSVWRPLFASTVFSEGQLGSVNFCELLLGFLLCLWLCRTPPLPCIAIFSAQHRQSFLSTMYIILQAYAIVWTFRCFMFFD